MLEITTAGVKIAVLGALGGALTYFLNQYVVEWYHSSVRTKRLRDALLVDCVEILQRVNNLPLQFDRTATLSDRDDLRQARNHPNGFVICGPMTETRELVTLLDPLGSRLVVRFFERWEMFSILESRYTGIYQKLLETAAECMDLGMGQGNEAGDDARSVRELREEYWEQLRSSLAAMRAARQDLCYFACRIFRHLGKFNEPKLAKYSTERWTTWQEFETEFRRYDTTGVQPSSATTDAPAADSTATPLPIFPPRPHLPLGKGSSRKAKKRHAA